MDELFLIEGNPKGFIIPDKDDTHHIAKVKRHSVGDLIWFTNGEGTLYQTVITHLERQSVQCKIIQQVSETKSDQPVQLYCGRLTKSNRAEWLVEKAVELGAASLTFFESDFTQPGSLKTDRLQKIADEALKQSKRFYKMKVESGMKLDSIVQKTGPNIFICHEKQSSESSPIIKQLIQPGYPLHILIGPEGGFSEREIALAGSKGWKQIYLGDHRLRVETAALHSLSVISHFLKF